MTRVALCAATRWEAAALRSAFGRTQSCAIHSIPCEVARRSEMEWWIIPMGIGPVRAAATAETVLDAQRFDALWSTGFAGALAPATIGEILIGTQVHRADRRQDDPRACATSLVDWAQATLRGASVPFRRGAFVSTSQVLCRAEDKRAMATRSGAVAVDMESAALAEAAAARDVPFGILRTVSDLVEEDLPLDFNLFLRPSGWAQGLWACLTHPVSLLGLNRLRVQSRAAGAHLTTALRAWAEQPSPIEVGSREA